MKHVIHIVEPAFDRKSTPKLELGDMFESHRGDTYLVVRRPGTQGLSVLCLSSLSICTAPAHLITGTMAFKRLYPKGTKVTLTQEAKLDE